MNLRAAARILTALCLSAGAAHAQLFAPATSVLMTPQSAAGVNSQTLFRQDAVVAALPGLRITQATVQDEGGPRTVFLASDGGEVLLRIYGGPDGRVSMAEGISRKIYAPGRIRVGMRFAQTPEGARAYCVRGEDRWAGTVFCGATENATLWLVFEPRGAPTAGDGAETPPDALAEAELIQIRWSATPGLSE